MRSVHEIATVTSKGQITLPKPIRQALGLDVGAKLAFELRGSEVVVSRADDLDQHQDPAIESFLSLLEDGIQSGRHVSTLPEDLAREMLAKLSHSVDFDEDILGDVAL